MGARRMPREWPNTGKPPREKTISLGIRWANGRASRHEYTAAQLRWTITGDDWDIRTFWRVNGQDDLEGGDVRISERPSYP